MADIDRDLWLRAMDEADIATRSDDQAVTPIEFAALFNISRIMADRRLQRLVEVGAARRTKKRVVYPSGRMCVVTAYRLAECAPKKRR